MAKVALIIGGTGRLGRFVVEEFLSGGWSVRVGVRRGQVARRVWGDKIEVIEGDFRERGTVRRGMEGVSAVYLNPPAGPRFEDDFKISVKLCESVCSEVSHFSVERIALLSGASHIIADNPFPPIRAKALMEEAVISCGIPWTIWRATWFMEALFDLVRFGVIALPGRGDIAVHWIAAKEFAGMVFKSFSHPGCQNKILFAFGPEVVTFKEAVQEFRNALYPRRLIVPLPLSLLSGVGKLPGMGEAWYGAQLMRYFQTTPEVGDPEETFALLGPSRMSLKLWLEEKRAKFSRIE